MRAGSVHVVMRHAIVEVQCVNVVIGVHIVVLCVLLVVVRVVPIFLVVIPYFSLYSHGILGVVFIVCRTVGRSPIPQNSKLYCISLAS